MKLLSGGYTAIVYSLLFVCTVCIDLLPAQEAKKFASKGTFEFGGGLSFQSITRVSSLGTSDPTYILVVSPIAGYFLTDGFELGLRPLSVTFVSYPSGNITIKDRSIQTSYSAMLAPAYNFSTGGIMYPFIEGLFGYAWATFQSPQFEDTGRQLSWGGRAGIKLSVAGNALLNFGLQYLQTSQNPGEYQSRVGSNEITFTVGFSVWL